MGEKNYFLATRSEGRVPYLIPVGGSTSVGTWGYIEAYRELIEQVRMNYCCGCVF